VDPGSLARGSLAAALFAALSSGCSSPLEKIEIDESGVPGGGARVFLPVEGAERLEALRAGDREGAAGKYVGLAFELGWSGDDAEQLLGPGDDLRLEDVTFTGPGTVLHDYGLGTASLTVVQGTIARGGGLIGLELGANATVFDLESELAGARDQLRAESIGPLVGLRLGWVSPWRVALRGRFAYTAELPLDTTTDDAETRTYEVGLQLPLGRWAALDGGWRWKDYDSRRDGSDVELDLDGLFLSLGFGPY